MWGYRTYVRSIGVGVGLKRVTYNIYSFSDMQFFVELRRQYYSVKLSEVSFLITTGSHNTSCLLKFVPRYHFQETYSENDGGNVFGIRMA